MALHALHGITLHYMAPDDRGNYVSLYDPSNMSSPLYISFTTLKMKHRQFPDRQPAATCPYTGRHVSFPVELFPLLCSKSL
jgi:hypothetical protein